MPKCCIATNDRAWPVAAVTMIEKTSDSQGSQASETAVDESDRSGSDYSEKIWRN